MDTAAALVRLVWGGLGGVGGCSTKHLNFSLSGKKEEAIVAIVRAHIGQKYWS